MAKWKIWIFSILFMALDGATFLFLNLALMEYEDHYNESKGEYWSWEISNSRDKMIVISLQVWWLIHLAAICYILYRLVKRWRMIRRQTAV